MNKRDFHNILRILRCIDHHELPWMDRERWGRFRRDPHDYCIRCTDTDYDRIWAVIEARQPKAVACEMRADERAGAVTRPTDQATRCRELLQQIVDGPAFTTDLSVVCRLASALALATSVEETLIARDMRADERAESDRAEREGPLNAYLRLRGGME